MLLEKQSVEVAFTHVLLKVVLTHPAALRGIFLGKAYERGLEYHITTSLAILMPRFDSIMSKLPKAQIQVQSLALKNTNQQW